MVVTRDRVIGNSFQPTPSLTRYVNSSPDAPSTGASGGVAPDG